MATRIKTPEDYWAEFRELAYAGPLDPNAERELSKAFYAGIETVFRFMQELPDEDIDKVSLARLKLFNMQNKLIAHTLISGSDS